MSSMTAEQVWALVKDWPREAWPDTLHYGNRAEWGQDCAAWRDDRCSVPTSDTTTAHAFVGSGLAWLARNHKQGVLWLLDEDNWACAYQRLPRQNSWGDSPLAAVSAAVLAAAKEGA